ncbi:MAG: methyltransferase [bacterium]|nr:methyltransferase [bacterium]
MHIDSHDDDWQPTPHGIFFGEVLAAHPELFAGRDVLELGGGVGNHTVPLIRMGAATVTTTEIVASRSETTRRNVGHNCPDATGVDYRVADWLHTEGQFDVVVTNPPFAKSGKRNRRYFIDSLILDSHKRLRAGGGSDLIFIQSSMADIEKTKRRLAENGYTAEILGSSEGPFRDYYFEDATFMEEIRTVEGGFEIRDGTHYETLFVVKARLESWSPPEGAHLS